MDWKDQFPKENRYFETDNGILYQCNCLETLGNFPDNSIDFIFTDPPYGTNDGKGKAIKRGSSIVDFCTIQWDDTLPLDWIEFVYKIMKDDTWGVTFTDKNATLMVWNKLEECKLNPRNTFYWIKTNKAPTPRSNFKSCVETAVVFTKGRTNQKWRGGGNQNNFINLPFVSGREKVKHPTQKPLKLIEHLLSFMTDENDVVLDPFAGSGTTAVACEKLNRKWIGIELNKEYCDIIVERLKKGVDI